MRPAINRRSVVLGGAAALAAAASGRAQDAGFAAAAAYSKARRGVSLLVMRRGEILFEDYPRPGAPQKGWQLASGTKSFTGVMAAAAVQDGLLTLDERVADTVPEWRSDPRKSRITIRHLLSLTSGLEERGAAARPPTYADALKAAAVHEPGAVFNYGPTSFQVFGEVLRRKLNRDPDPAAYLQRRVLDPIGVRPTRWARGSDGMPRLPQGAHVTARDWAAFGWWVLEGGRGLVDADALAACFEPSAANPGYGLSWWLLRPGLIPPSPVSGVAEIDADALGRDIRMAAGAGDQRLYLLPREQMVIARQANHIFRAMRARGGDRWNDADFLRLLRDV